MKSVEVKSQERRRRCSGHPDREWCAIEMVTGIRRWALCFGEAHPELTECRETVDAHAKMVGIP